ncbi:MAG TPA: histidine kinase [Candidatus Dormibacteraeota bacterium]|jgi:two-component system LytT family sensor kinase|nr:histidine kinase [Candidatus Dormibacteraeota bacterium]
MGVLEGLLVQALLTAVAAVAVYLLVSRQRRSFGSAEDRATLRTLALATSTMGALRRGLTARSAAEVLPEVAEQAGAAVALYDTEGLLAFEPGPPGPADGHRLHLEGDATAVLEALTTGRLRLLSVHDEAADGCALRAAAVAPLLVNDRPVAALVSYHPQTPGPTSLRITSDLAELLATQLRLQQADQQRVALVRSELRALRAQISPHFIYNTLTTIASFIRTDPDRARELLTLFADFTRKAFRGPQDEFASLADELVYVHQYLLFEQARFGDRLTVRYKVEPEVLNAIVPTLVVQPLVENAVKHGMESSTGRGTVSIIAEDRDDECWIVVRDNGRGFDATLLAAGDGGGALANIDRRLRETFGPSHGLNIDSLPGTGTTVRMRIPKYRPGVHLS